MNHILSDSRKREEAQAGLAPGKRESFHWCPSVHSSYDSIKALSGALEDVGVACWTEKDHTSPRTDQWKIAWWTNSLTQEEWTPDKWKPWTWKQAGWVISLCSYIPERYRIALCWMMNSLDYVKRTGQISMGHCACQVNAQSALVENMYFSTSCGKNRWEQ